MVVSDAESIDQAELDDPAGQGIDHAMAKFHEDFVAWASAMPAKLVPPVLDILRKAHATLDGSRDAANAAAVALQAAFDFLSGCLPSACGQSDAAELRMRRP
jgi:hypothetical protein